MILNLTKPQAKVLKSAVARMNKELRGVRSLGLAYTHFIPPLGRYNLRELDTLSRAVNRLDKALMRNMEDCK